MLAVVVPLLTCDLVAQTRLLRQGDLIRLHVSGTAEGITGMRSDTLTLPVGRKLKTTSLVNQIESAELAKRVGTQASSGVRAGGIVEGASGPTEPRAERVHTQLIVGGGLSFAGGDSVSSAGAGLAGHLGLRHQRENLVFSIRVGTNYGGSADVNIPGGLRDRFDEIALMAGYAVHISKSSQIVLSSGVASLWGERVGTGPAPHFATTNVPFQTTVGVPVQMTVSAPDGTSGLGLTVHANLNPEEVYGALTVTYLIALGRLR
jgi:hypothetical protein